MHQSQSQLARPGVGGGGEVIHQRFIAARVSVCHTLELDRSMDTSHHAAAAATTTIDVRAS